MESNFLLARVMFTKEVKTNVWSGVEQLEKLKLESYKEIKSVFHYVLVFFLIVLTLVFKLSIIQQRIFNIFSYLKSAVHTHLCALFSVVISSYIYLSSNR